MFRANHFDKLLDKATSSLRLEPDWPTILEICDLIRQNDCSPKYAVGAVKKKLYSQNPHQAMFGVLTLESVVKNCGSGIHDEVASKPFCETLRDLVKTTQYENLRTKILELIQAWAFAFRNTPRYRAVQDTVNILKAEGYKFPALKESDAMFSADTAPDWADGEVCHRCRVAFSLMVRRHHCRACGQVFCQQCSSKTSTLPKFGIEKEVRVCDACYDKVSRPPSAASKLEIVDTSSDYGPTQPQKRPEKSAEELQEEEELQLALALSQSEAEQKEKDRLRTRTHIAPEPTSLHPTVSPTPSSVSASPEHSTGNNSELSRYLDRNYWEQRLSRDPAAAPTAPADLAVKTEEYVKPASSKIHEEEQEDKEIDEFVENLKSQVEIFVNRMKSNSSRGRSIANDTSVQTLFMNITAMHSQLLRYIQQLDDKRVYLESLQDKITQVRDSRAALDTLRAEHAARLAAAAEAAERQRQMQMAVKLQAMRKKKHEYLQYQRQLALQKVQEQEREMQMRQEQQKHQYMMSAGSGYFMPGVTMQQQYQPGFPNQQMYGNPSQFHQMMPQSTADSSNMMPGQAQMSQANIPMGVNPMATVSQTMPQMSNAFGMTASGMVISQPSTTTQQTISQPNIRPSLGQQMPMQQQMLMQQMHQMRMPMQPGVHQMMTQNITNGPGQNIPQQNGQPNQPKQNMPNQPQPSNPMMMGQGVPSTQTQISGANPMLGMQHQNVRLPMMQGNPPNIGQQFPSGYPPQNIPSHLNTQQPGAQIPNMHQSQMQLPGQHMPLGGQPSIPGHQPSSINPGLPMPNHIPSANPNMPQGPHQVPQSQGQQVPPQQQTNQGAPGQAGPPGPQLNAPGQVVPGQNMPQHGQMNQLPMVQGQLPHGQGSQVYHAQQLGQQISQQLVHSLPVQQMGQGPPIQGQQMPQGPQGSPGQVPQNQPGPPSLAEQPNKIPQQNFGNAPPPQQLITNTQPQTGVKLERNNNSTAELISFD